MNINSFSHVPPPDPGNFWPFNVGQTQTIGIEPLIAFRVDEILETEIRGVLFLGNKERQGILLMNITVIMVRTLVEPLVTMTLRKIEGRKALIQVTADPRIPVEVRQ